MMMKKMIFCLALIMFAPCYAKPLLDKNIIIFVSFSMPDESLKEWIREANLIGAPVVMRGFTNNSFKETVNKIYLLTKENQGGVQIDPALFQKYQITKVPAVVAIKEQNCMANMSCTLDYDIVYGDVTLAYALNKIQNQEDHVSQISKEDILLLQRNSHV
jgi:conjugal transfer pilus assembly protein TrbC